MALVHINNTNPDPARGLARARRPSSARESRLPTMASRSSYDRDRTDTDGASVRRRRLRSSSPQLRAQGTRYHNLHPFHRRMDGGELTREELQRWVAESLLLPEVHPAQGRGDPGQLPRGRGPARVDPAASSITTAPARAPAASSPGCGSARRSAYRGEHLESERGVLPAVRYAVDAYVNFARQRPWVEAVASSLTELFGPGRDRVRLEALERHYAWIDPGGARVLPHAAGEGATRRAVRADADGGALPDA